MALIDLTQLRAAIRRGRAKRRVDDRLRAIRHNIKHFERQAREAYRGRNIRLSNSFSQKAAAWRKLEESHLARIA